jgi:hypothetical protein
LLEPKTVSATRRVKGLAMPMILIVTAQELRKAVDHPICAEVIADSIREIEHDFVKPDLRCVPETVGPNGEVYDTFEGRTVCPGHSLEAALSRSEKLGARVLVLRVHYLLGETFRLSGDRASADDHQRRARQLLDEVRKEARTDAILARHDLSAVQKSFSQR